MGQHASNQRIVIIGAGIGGLTTAALLAQSGYRVVVLEASTYPGGSAGTFFHREYRFDAGATIAGGFHNSGPHTVIGKMLGIQWPVRPFDPAWIVHLPDQDIALTRDNGDVLKHFPASEPFWQEQARLADIGWSLSAQGLPWPPSNLAELLKIAETGLRHMPRALALLPLVSRTAYQWAAQHGLGDDAAFVRFLDAQLLISAQTTARQANAVYSATALDLTRQGVYYVEGGMGGLAETLVDAIKNFGGEIHYRRAVTRIYVEEGRVSGVSYRDGKHAKQDTFLPCDFVIGNVTPWSLDALLREDSPTGLRKDASSRPAGWGAFVLHLGIHANGLPDDMPDHHQIITNMEGPLGEGRSIFVSLSPEWDTTRAPANHRAVTITTHTAVRPWWDLVEHDHAAYEDRKAIYTERILAGIERAIPGFRERIDLLLPGTPVTYNRFTRRHLGMVGGFPMRSLFKARGPLTGIPNLRLVGDSIFPGQSTAGVMLGALRVVRDIQHSHPRQVAHPYLRRVSESSEL